MAYVNYQFEKRRKALEKKQKQEAKRQRKLEKKNKQGPDGLTGNREGRAMGKVLSCKDVGVDCDFVIHGKDEADVLRQAAVHAKGCHQGVQMTPEVQAKVRAAIKDEHSHGSSSCCGGGSCG